MKLYPFCLILKFYMVLSNIIITFQRWTVKALSITTFRKRVEKLPLRKSLSYWETWALLRTKSLEEPEYESKQRGICSQLYAE